MIGYIIIGVFAIVILYIAILYFVNSKKIKKAQSKATAKDAKAGEKKDASKADGAGKKVEVKSEVVKGSYKDASIEDLNRQSQQAVIEAFKKIDEAEKAFESRKQTKGYNDNGRLKLDRSNFKSELQKSLENAKISSETNKMKFETAKMGEEGIPQTSNDTQTPAKKQARATTLGEEINNMSPELKTVLLNDILNKKY